MADRVGAIYVEVFADTTDMKRQIEKGGRQAGAKAGRESGNLFGQEFEEQLNRALKQIHILPGLQAEIKRVSSTLADSITKGLGKTEITLVPKLDTSVFDKAIAGLSKSTVTVTPDIDVEAFRKALDSVSSQLFTPDRSAIANLGRSLTSQLILPDGIAGAISDSVFNGVGDGLDRLATQRGNALATALGAAAGSRIGADNPRVQQRADELGPSKEQVAADEDAVRLREQERDAIREKIRLKEQEKKAQQGILDVLREEEGTQKDINAAVRKRTNLMAVLRRLKKQEAAATEEVVAAEEKASDTQRRRAKAQADALKEEQSRVNRLTVAIKKLDLAQADVLATSQKAADVASDAMRKEESAFQRSLKARLAAIKKLTPKGRFFAELDLKPVIDQQGLVLPPGPKWELTPEISNEQLRKSAKKVQRFFATEGKGSALPDFFNPLPVVRFNEALTYTNEQLEKIFKGDQVAANLAAQEIFDNDKLAESNGRMQDILATALQIDDASRRRKGGFFGSNDSNVEAFRHSIADIEVDYQSLMDTVRDSEDDWDVVLQKTTNFAKSLNGKLTEAEGNFRTMQKQAKHFGDLNPGDHWALFQMGSKLAALREQFTDFGHTVMDLAHREAVASGQISESLPTEADFAHQGSLFKELLSGRAAEEESAQKESLSRWKKFGAAFTKLQDAWFTTRPLTMFDSTKEGFVQQDAGGNRVGEAKSKLGVGDPVQTDIDSWWKKWSKGFAKSVKKIPLKIPTPSMPRFGGGGDGGGDDEKRIRRMLDDLRRGPGGGGGGGGGGGKGFFSGFFDGAENIAKKMPSLFGKSGDDSGKSFGKGFGSALFSVMRGNFSAIFRLFKSAGPQLLAGLAGPLATVAQGAASAVSVLASSLYQAVGALGAAVPVAVGLGGALAGIVVASKDVAPAVKTVASEFFKAAKEGKAFSMNTKEIQEAMKGLTPEAKDFVRAFADLLPGFQKFQKAAEGKLFAGLGDSLRELSETAIPAVYDGLLTLVDASNTVIKEGLGRMAAFNWTGLFGNLAPSVEAIGGVFANLSEAFFTFVRAATPAANALSDAFEKWSSGFLAAVQTGETSGGINDTLMRMQESLKAVLGLLGAAGGALHTFFMAGGDEGNALITRMTGFFDTLNEKMKTPEGAAALDQFFASAGATLTALMPLITSLGAAFSHLITPDSIEILGNVATSLGTIIETIGMALTIVQQSGFLEFFLGTIAAIAGALQPLFPVLLELAGVFRGAFQGILGALAPALMQIGQALVPIFQALIGPLSTVINLIAGVFINAINTLLPILLPILDTLAQLAAEYLPMLADAIGPVIEALAGAFFDALAALLPALAPIMTIFVQMAESILPAITDTLVPLIGLLGEALVDAVVALIPALLDIAQVFVDNIDIVTQIVLLFAEFLRVLIPLIPPLVTIAAMAIELAVSIASWVLPAVSKFIGLLVDMVAMFNDRAIPVIQKFSDWLLRLKDKFTEVLDKISDFVTRGYAYLSQFRDDVLNIFAGILDRVGDTWDQMYSLIVAPFKRAFDWIADHMPSIDDIPGIGLVKKIVPFAAEGDIVLGAQHRIVGEAGPEAIVPLTRPMSMIKPNVRPMAAAIRGYGWQQPSPQKVINLTQNITPQQSDPKAVATSVVNNAVALARL